MEFFQYSNAAGIFFQAVPEPSFSGTDYFQSLCPMLLQLHPHTIHYHVFGKGPRLLFCLHGYGETGIEFAALGNSLGDAYTLVCPDLPLHGNTRWEAASFGVEDLYGVLVALAAAEGKNLQASEPFCMAGYSMGGRLALSLAERYPDTLSELFLVAPDGLKMNFWYWLSTQTTWGNLLFRKTMERPNWLFSGMEMARSLHLLNQSIYKFTHRFLDDPRQRQDLYTRWTYFRHFRPDKNNLQRLIRRHGLRTLLFFGKYDRIITAKQGRRFARSSGEQTGFYLLEAGHRLLKPSNATTIAEIILTGKKASVTQP